MSKGKAGKRLRNLERRVAALEAASVAGADGFDGWAIADPLITRGMIDRLVATALKGRGLSGGTLSQQERIQLIFEALIRFNEEANVIERLRGITALAAYLLDDLAAAQERDGEVGEDL